MEREKAARSVVNSGFSSLGIFFKRKRIKQNACPTPVVKKRKKFAVMWSGCFSFTRVLQRDFAGVLSVNQETRCRCWETVCPAVLSLLFCPHPAFLSCWPTAALDQTSWYTIWVWLTLSLLVSPAHSTVICHKYVSAQIVHSWQSWLKLNNSERRRWAHSHWFI